MNIKTLSLRAMSVIDQYANFSVGKATCSVPYFNNKVTKARGALRVYGGKGSPKDIYEEVTASLTKEHIAIDALDSVSLKKYLTDRNIGLDCSGLAYYILNAESEEQGRGPLDKKIHFINAGGLLGKIRSALRPVENCNVATFTDNKNSRIIDTKNIQPGDMITMIAKMTNRDHILVVNSVEYQNYLPIKIFYTHTIAYPEDGMYGTGLKQGSIDFTDLEKNILEFPWSETNLLTRAREYTVEVRRLNWF